MSKFRAGRLSTQNCFRMGSMVVLLTGLSSFVSPGQAQQERSAHTWTITFQLKADERNNPRVDGCNYVPTVTDKLPYQRRTSLRVEGADRYFTTTDEGNELLMAQIAPARTIRVVYKAITQPYNFLDVAKDVKIGASLSTEARLFLGPSQSVFYENPDLKRIDPNSKLAQAVVSEIKSETVLGTVEGILSWMQKHVTYKALNYPVTANAGGYYLVADDVLQRGYGECGGWSAAFVELCRAAGVPARDVWGVIKDTPVGKARQGKLTGHAWAEIYIGGLGWAPVEPQRPGWLGTAPEGYIRMAHYPLSTAQYPWHFVPQYSIFFLGGNTPDFVEELTPLVPEEAPAGRPAARNNTKQ